MGQACASKQNANAAEAANADMGVASPVMIAQKVDLQAPAPAGAENTMNAEPMKAQAAAAAIASRDASPMPMAHGGNTMEAAAALNNQAVAMAQPMAVQPVAENWQECTNCDVTHEVVSDGVYRDIRTGEMVVDSNVHRTSQTQPIVHPEQVMYEEAPVQEIIEEAVAPAPYTHAPMAPMGQPMAPMAQAAPAHNNEGNNIIVGAMAVHRGDDVDEMEQPPQPEEPAAPENQMGDYPEMELAYADHVGGEPSEEVQAEPEKRRKKRGKKKRPAHPFRTWFK